MDSSCCPFRAPGSRPHVLCLLAAVLCVLFGPLLCRAQNGPASGDDASTATSSAAARADEAQDDTTQASRAAQWRRKREAKAASLEPPSSSTSSFASSVEDAVGRVGSTVFGNQILLDIPELSVAGVRPAFGGLHHEATATAGLDYVPPYFEAPGRLVRAQALVSLNRYAGLSASYASESGEYLHYAYARFHHRPEDEFYGIGPRSDKDQESVFRINETLVGGLLGRMLGDHLLVGTHASYRADRYGRGRPTPDELPVEVTFADAQVPGIGVDADYAVVGGYFEYDRRNIPYEREFGSRFAPVSTDRIRSMSLDATSGAYVSAEVTHHMDVRHNRYSYSTFTFDAQEYISIDEGTQHGLAFRQFVSFTHTAREQKVPFYHLRYLGGHRSLRGYATGRYRDRNVVMVNGEVRCQVWHWLDMALFVDAGHVFGDVTDLSFRTIRGNVGVGFRLRSNDGTLARFEVAGSTEGLRTYLSFGSIL